MKADLVTEWSCGSCDGITVEEPKWWPTLEKESKFETSVGVCQTCFRLLLAQIVFENKKPRKAKTAKKAAKSKSTGKKSTSAKKPKSTKRK